MAKSDRGISRFAALFVGMILSSGGCQDRIESGPPAPAPSLRSAPKRPVSALGRNESCGKASYYSDSLAGNPTASGEIYSPTKLSAAHLTLPFGTKVTVALKGNTSKRVELKVNDRGPHGDARRILDLSRAAFERLGATTAGVLDVCMSWHSLQ